jgi:hypothetical protein
MQDGNAYRPWILRNGAERGGVDFSRGAGVGAGAPAQISRSRMAMATAAEREGAPSFERISAT